MGAKHNALTNVKLAAGWEFVRRIFGNEQGAITQTQRNLHNQQQNTQVLTKMSNFTMMKSVRGSCGEASTT
jgi:hypothetical protein